jgi:hypothetical protein
MKVWLIGAEQFAIQLDMDNGDLETVEIWYSDNSSSLLYDRPANRQTHFTGFMWEEQIVVSLWDLGFNI